MKKRYLILLSALLLAADLYTKHLTETFLNLNEYITVIPNFFDIHYARNTGAAWSMFDGGWMHPIFIVLSLSVSCYALYTFVKKDHPLLLVSLPFILAGNLGNFYDRVRFQYVRDMLSFNLFGYPYPIFNVADICLVIGFGLLMLYVYLEENKVKQDGKNNNINP